MGPRIRHSLGAVAAAHYEAPPPGVSFLGIGVMSPRPGYGGTWAIPGPNNASAPSGTFLVAVMQDDTGNGPSHITAPTGWTAASGTAYFVTGFTSFYIFTKRAGAGEPTSYTFSSGGSDPKLAFILGYSNVNATPHDAATTTSLSQTGSVSAPSITTATANAMHIAIAVAASGANLGTLSTPANYDPRSNTASLGFAVYDRLIAPPGATGSKTIVASGFAGQAAGVSIALRAA